MTERYSINDLLYLMARLRDPEAGCPWDCRQSPKTLTPFTLEEAYEVVDAIERGDIEHLPEELGDLLFQVIFYGRLGEESGDFDFGDIVHRLVAKLVWRHPHVFPEGTLESRRDPALPPAEPDIAASWESLKKEERHARGRTGLLADVPVAFPALVRAQKIQKRAAKAGFDWDNVGGVIDKVREELDELTGELEHGSPRTVEEELGDLLFSVTNLARFTGSDAEQSLRRATDKFSRRFEMMEAMANSEGGKLETFDRSALEALWQRTKSEKY